MSADRRTLSELRWRRSAETPLRQAGGVVAVLPSRPNKLDESGFESHGFRILRHRQPRSKAAPSPATAMAAGSGISVTKLRFPINSSWAEAAEAAEAPGVAHLTWPQPVATVAA